MDSNLLALQQRVLESCCCRRCCCCHRIRGRYRRSAPIPRMQRGLLRCHWLKRSSGPGAAPAGAHHPEVRPPARGEHLAAVGSRQQLLLSLCLQRAWVHAGQLIWRSIWRSAA